jgi:hypothetical protein
LRVTPLDIGVANDDAVIERGEDGIVADPEVADLMGGDNASLQVEGREHVSIVRFTTKHPALPGNSCSRRTEPHENNKRTRVSGSGSLCLFRAASATMALSPYNGSKSTP